MVLNYLEIFWTFKIFIKIKYAIIIRNYIKNIEAYRFASQSIYNILKFICTNTY